MNNKFFDFFKKIDWVNSLFLFTSPLIAIGGTAFLIWAHAIHWQTVVLSIIMAFLTGLAITAGYHRLFSHKAFEANSFLKLLCLLFGAAAFENSARRWSSDHRDHHKFVDTDKDPYNINRGFFFAHMGWVCTKYEGTHSYDNVPDLDNDPLVMFQDRHIFLLGVLISFVLPMAIASLWGDALGGLILAGFLRLVLNHHFTFSINSFCHMIGGQPYSDQNTARDSWFLALFTYGEGYHNFHHKFPADYRNGIRFYHWDPTKWLIKALSYVGVTYDLRKISNQKILLSRLRMEEKRLMSKLEKNPNHSTHLISKELVSSARLKLEEAYVRFQELKKDYSQLKEQKLNELSQQITHMNEKIEIMKRDLSLAQQKFHEAKEHWFEICRRLRVRPTSALS